MPNDFQDRSRSSRGERIKKASKREFRSRDSRRDGDKIRGGVIGRDKIFRHYSAADFERFEKGNG